MKLPMLSVLPALLLLAWLSAPAALVESRRVLQIPDDELVPVELATVGVDRAAGAPLVLLREPASGEVVPIWVGVAEAQAIALALHGIPMPRPMTHDLMANLLAELQAGVEEVLVHDMRDNTYFGTVRLRVPGEDALRDVDSRPSDALALALRTGAPIRVARRILRAAPEFDFLAPDGPDQVVQLLGITVVSPTPALRRELDLPDRPGVVVTSVAGRARDQGLRRGDLVVEVNGRPVREPMDFFLAVRATPAGEPVRITYARQGEEHRIEVPADLPPERQRPGGGIRV
jgi:uncharacterized protein